MAETIAPEAPPRQDTDLEIILFEEQDDNLACIAPDCTAEVKWMGLFSCGHAFLYCDEHQQYIIAQNAHRGLFCPEHGKPLPTYLLRWEHV